MAVCLSGVVPAGASEAREGTVVRVCKIELSEAGRATRFRFHYIYSLRTGAGGDVVEVERLDGRDYARLVLDEEFESCLRSWQLRAQSEFKTVISVGTTPEENSISVVGGSDFSLRLVIAKW